MALLSELGGCSIFTARLPQDADVSQLTEHLTDRLAAQQIALRGQIRFEGQPFADQSTQSLLVVTASSDDEQPRLSVAVAEVISLQLQLAGTDRTATVVVSLSDQAHQLYKRTHRRPLGARCHRCDCTFAPATCQQLICIYLWR